MTGIPAAALVLPKGSLSASRLDGKEDEIRHLLKLGVSKTAIAKITGVSRPALYSFMNTRGLRLSPSSDPRGCIVWPRHSAEPGPTPPSQVFTARSTGIGIASDLDTSRTGWTARRRIRNQQVSGSSPLAGSNVYRQKRDPTVGRKAV